MASVDDVGAGAMCRWGYWLHSCTSHCLASMFIANLHATPITCQLCTLQSLPPLQKQLEFWGLALLADLHCSVGVVWVPALLPCWHHGLPHSLLVSLINLHSSFLATCKQPELSGLALLADLHCDVGIVEVVQCCCHAGIMACQHYLCNGALLLPSIACQPLALVIAVQTALANLHMHVCLPCCMHA